MSPKVLPSIPTIPSGTYQEIPPGILPRNPHEIATDILIFFSRDFIQEFPQRFLPEFSDEARCLAWFLQGFFNELLENFSDFLLGSRQGLLPGVLH